MPDYYIRKARYEDEEDLEMFKKFFREIAESYESIYYSKHINWLDKKAFPDIRKGIRRLAFGVFFTDPITNDPHILGGIIIKKVDHIEYQHIELKTFTVANDLILRERLTKLNAYSQSDLNLDEIKKEIRSQLLYVIENFAKQRSIQKLKIDLPEENKILADVLYNYNFRFKGYRPSEYKKNSVIYTLEKVLSLRYCHDPYDFLKMSEWYIEKFLGFEITGVYEIENGYLYKISFELLPVNSNAEILTDKSHIIPGTAYVFLKEASKNQLNSFYSIYGEIPHFLTYVFSYNYFSKLKKYSEDNGIIHYTKEHLHDYLYPTETQNRDFPSESELFETDEIGGFLIVEDSMFSKRIKSREGEFKYYLLSSYGRTLHELKNSTSRELQIVFFSPNSSYYNRQGEIWGIGELLNAEIAKFNKCLEEFDSEKSIFNKDEFRKHYEARWDDSGNEEIIVLTINRLYVFPIPLNITHLVYGSLKDRIQQNLINGGLMNMYLDRETVNKVKSEQDKQGIPRSPATKKYAYFFLDSRTQKLTEPNGNRFSEILKSFGFSVKEISGLYEDFLFLKFELTKNEKENLHVCTQKFNEHLFEVHKALSTYSSVESELFELIKSIQKPTLLRFSVDNIVFTLTRESPPRIERHSYGIASLIKIHIELNRLSTSFKLAKLETQNILEIHNKIFEQEDQLNVLQDNIVLNTIGYDEASRQRGRIIRGFLSLIDQIPS